MFWTENKPAHTGLRCLGSITNTRSPEYRPATSPDGRAKEEQTNPELFQRLLARLLEEYSTPLDQATLKPRVERLENAARTLRDRGFHFILVEVPECIETYDSLQRTQFREQFRQLFPVDQIVWFTDFDRDNEFVSSDARHLSPASARRFTQKLVDFINKTGVGGSRDD